MWWWTRQPRLTNLWFYDLAPSDRGKFSRLVYHEQYTPLKILSQEQPTLMVKVGAPNPYLATLRSHGQSYDRDGDSLALWTYSSDVILGGANSLINQQ